MKPSIFNTKDIAVINLKVGIIKCYINRPKNNVDPLVLNSFWELFIEVFYNIKTYLV